MLYYQRTQPALINCSLYHGWCLRDASTLYLWVDYHSDVDGLSRYPMVKLLDTAFTENIRIAYQIGIIVPILYLGFYELSRNLKAGKELKDLLGIIGQIFPCLTVHWQLLV